MSPTPTPVRCASDAIGLLSRAATDPRRDETLAFLLDPSGIGGLVVVFDGAAPADFVLDVVHVMARVAARLPSFTALVVATVRPRGGVLPGDIDRWLDASDLAHRHGVELIEWYVIGRHGFECPRDLLGEPERWPG